MLAVPVAGLLMGCAAPRPGRALQLPPFSPPGTPEFARQLGDHLGLPTWPSNRVTELPRGDLFMPAMLEAIRSAQAEIRLEMYLLWSGHVGDQFVDALTERARHGVRTRLILDWFGSRKLASADRRRLREAGVELRTFHAGVFQTPARWNHRNHRKLLTVDRRVGFTGGAGLADMWAGLADSRPPWRDSMYVIRSPEFARKAVEQFEADKAAAVPVTASDWRQRSLLQRVAEVLIRLFEPLL
jgi:cardiolipin synthase